MRASVAGATHCAMAAVTVVVQLVRTGSGHRNLPDQQRKITARVTALLMLAASGIERVSPALSAHRRRQTGDGEPGRSGLGQ